MPRAGDCRASAARRVRHARRSARHAACALPRTRSAYTRWLATHHYENFHVVSFLLPKRLHQDFYNVYAYCRWADDLGDEIGDRAESLRLLAWWRERTGSACTRATPRIRCSSRCAAPCARIRFRTQPFADLIQAFVQDQTVTRYRDLGRAVRVLPLFRQSGGPAGAVSVRLLRRGTRSACPTPPAPPCNSPISGRT